MYDENLTPLLEKCSNEELDPLVNFLLEPRSSLLAKDPDYLCSNPDHGRYLGAIVKEIRLFGGHTIKDRVVGSPGRAWRMIVRDALLELGVKAPPLALREMEHAVVKLALDSEFDKLDKAARDKLLDGFYRGSLFRSGLSQRTVLVDFISRAEGNVSTPELETEKVKRVLGQKAVGLVKKSLKGKAVSTGLKLVLRGAAAPIGVGLTAWDLLGPAYRVTIPVICYIAYLRHKHEK